jgi:hypothetical protein
MELTDSMHHGVGPRNSDNDTDERTSSEEGQTLEHVRHCMTFRPALKS